jgi:hypothetical protein
MVKGDTEQVYEFYREDAANEADACGGMYCYVYENNMIP